MPIPDAKLRFAAAALRVPSVVAGLVLIGCGVVEPIAAPVVAEPPPAAARVRTELCASAGCYVELARRDQRAGVLDRASASLARAYALEPSDAMAERWIAALIASEQERAALDAIATIRAAGRAHASLDALEARAREAATEASQTGPGSLAALVDAAELAWSQAETRAARAAWSAARITLDERGASLSLLTSPRWSPDSLAWRGDRLELYDRLELDGEDMLVRRSFMLAADGPIRERSHELAALGSDRVVELGEGHTLHVGPEAVELRSQAGRSLATLRAGGEYQRSGEVCGGDAFSGGWTTTTIAIEVEAFAVRDDLRYLAIGRTDGEIELLDRRTGRRHALRPKSRERKPGAEGRLILSSDPPRNIPYALGIRDDELLAVTSYGEVWRWRLRDRKLLGHDPSPCPASGPGQISRSGRLVASPSSPYEVCVGALDTGEVLARFEMHPRDLAFDGAERLALLDDAGQLWIWSRELGLSRVEQAEAGVHERVTPGPTGPPPAPRPGSGRTLRLSPDGRTLIAPELWVERWRAWDTASGEAHPLVPPAAGPIVAVSDDGRRAALVGPEGVEIWRDGALEREIEGSGPAGTVALLGPSGALLVIDDGEAQTRARLIELDEGRERALTHHPGETLEYAADPQAKLLARGEVDGPLELWSLTTGARVYASPPATRVARFALASEASAVAWVETRGGDEWLTHVAFDQAEPQVSTSPEPILGGAFGLALVGDSVLVATGVGLTRWDRRSADQTRTPWPEQVRFGRDPLRFACSADGEHLLVARSRIAWLLSSALELEATIELIGDEWLVETPSGAVDGSPAMPRLLLSRASDPDGEQLFGGALAWDRFAVPGLIPALLAGHRIEPMFMAAEG